MTLFKPANRDEFIQLCQEYGIDYNGGKGMPPVAKLRKALNNAGHGISMEDYRGTERDTAPRVKSYGVTLYGPVETDKGVKDMPVKVTLSVAEIRELAGDKTTGRLSHDAILSAVARSKGIDLDKFKVNQIAMNY